ncbi:transposase [Empedobacter tilapiae]
MLRCCGKVTKIKKLEVSVHKPLCDKMDEKLSKNKLYHHRLVKRRSSIVESVLGTLINFFNLKRINSRVISQANKHVLMSSLSYNLKKYALLKMYFHNLKREFLNHYIFTI